MSNRSDWKVLAAEIGGDEIERDRIEKELHNAFVAGQEAESKVLEDLRRARKWRDDARSPVLDWMRAETEAGRFRRNDQAPGWADYEAAEVALDMVREKHQT